MKIPSGFKHNTIGNSNHGYNYLQTVLKSDPDNIGAKIVEIVGENRSLNWAMEIERASDKSYTSLAKNCVTHLASDNSKHHAFSVRTVIDLWAWISYLSSGLAPNLIKTMISTTNLCQTLIDEGFSTARVDLYSTIVKLGVDEAQQFSKWCAESLSTIQDSIWKEDISDTCSMCSLSFALSTTKFRPALDIGFSDAIVAHAENAMDGTTEEIPNLREMLPQLIDCLKSQAARRLLVSQIIAKMRLKAGKVGDRFFYFYSSIMDADSLLASESPIETIFIPLIKESCTTESVAWIGSIVNAEQKFLERSKEEADLLEIFTSRARSASENESLSDDTKTLLTSIIEYVSQKKNNLPSG